MTTTSWGGWVVGTGWFGGQLEMVGWVQGSMEGFLSEYRESKEGYFINLP